MKRICVIVLVLAMLLSTWRDAMAAPILYTLAFVANGELDGKRFDHKPLTIVVFSDTTQVSGDPTSGFTAVPSGTGVMAQIRERQQPDQRDHPLILLLVSIGLLLFPQILQTIAAAIWGDGTTPKLVLEHPAFSSYNLSSALDKIETRATFTAPLVFPLVQDGVPVTLSIDSIKNNVVEFRAQILEGS